MQFPLDLKGIHGVKHWARVYVNGKKIAEKQAGVRLDVITLFAFLHDHKRIDEGRDINHGARAALAVNELRGRYFEIDNEGFQLLQEAMSGHSHGGTDKNITVQACYDADRLDLGRIGIRPDPEYLCTKIAKDPEFIQAAFLRSIR